MTTPVEPGRWSSLDDFWSQLVACHDDVPDVLRVIADRVVELLGEGCVLAILSPDGAALQPEIVTHADPVVQEAIESVLQADEARAGQGLAGTVAANRRSIVLNHLEPQAVLDAIPTPCLPFVRTHPMWAIMMVPLTAAEALVGTLGAIRTSSAEPFTAGELQLLEALAERAALALVVAAAGARAVGTTDFEALYLHNLSGVIFATPDGSVLAANPAACRILRRSERAIIEGGRAAIMDVDDPAVATALEERRVSGRVRAELTMHHGDGSAFVADTSSVLYTRPDGQVRAVITFQDVSTRVFAHQTTMARVAELERTSDRDPLTGLRNRRGFHLAAEEALSLADRDGSVSQVVFLDIDGLKAINDEQGHAVGDEAIMAVASAVEHSLRTPDVASRFGGDEFVVLLVGTASAAVPAIVDRIADELAANAEAPHPLTFTVGVVERPPGRHLDLDALVDAADRAMYHHRLMHRFRRRR